MGDEGFIMNFRGGHKHPVTSTCVFVEARFMIDERWKQPKCSSTVNDKLWYMYTVEYYSALQRNEILTHATP